MIVEIPNIVDPRGQLLFMQTGAQVPFDIRRLFVIHRMPEGAERGGHAHREQHQFIVMLEGSCAITVDNGEVRIPVTLDSSRIALHAPPMLWLELSTFSAGAVCAVLTSGDYDEADYIRERSEFDRLTRA